MYVYIYMYVYWLVVQPLWKIWANVTWDDEIPKIWKNKIHVPNHQPDIYIQDGAPKTAKLPYKWFNYGLW